jgi:hydroxyacylglutathione hydrolase
MSLQPKMEISEEASWKDDYFVVERIDSQTYSIGEPRYWQRNLSYLIIGNERAVLFDTGPGVRDIRPIVRELTSVPVTVIPSHLHYDHASYIGGFDSVALLDNPTLRAQVSADGLFLLTGEQHLGAVEKIPPPTFKVDTWLPSESVLELGGRALEIIASPGHTPESVMLLDESRALLFTGDFIYPGALLAILPGADLKQYAKSAVELVSRLKTDITLLPGHGSQDETVWRTPRLGLSDMKDLASALQRLSIGMIEANGIFPHEIRVNEKIVLRLPFSWNT